MKQSEEFYEIGGPIILEEPSLDKKPIKSKDSSTEIANKCPAQVLAKASQADASIADLVFCFGTGGNTNCCCLDVLLKLG